MPVIVLGAPAREGGGCLLGEARPGLRRSGQRLGEVAERVKGQKAPCLPLAAPGGALGLEQFAAGEGGARDPERPVARRLGPEAGVGEGGLERVGEGGMLLL